MISKATGAVRRLWWYVRGWLVSRAQASAEYTLACGMERTAGELVAKANSERDDAEARNRSAQVVIREREQEIALLRKEKEQLEATIEVRDSEITELTKWLERVNKRLDADIAQEVARENKSLHPANRAQAD